jgi:putative YhdH/YhfP family quinone oxidoreductase
VPGIDAAGTVVASQAAAFPPGTEVIVTGFDFGSVRWGGYADRTRVPADWLVPLPVGLTSREAMALGTAGFTAAQSVLAIQHAGITPACGEVLVTGASGGVGSVAVALLARLGYRVVAATGKPAAHPLLTKLGAAEIVGREALADPSGKPLLATRWVGAIDTVGGAPLGVILRSTKYSGCVTACGLTAGVDLPLTVYPFILRGVQLVGIDSVGASLANRAKIWGLFAGEWKLDLSEVAEEIGLGDVPTKAAELLAGGGWGRTVVRVTE